MGEEDEGKALKSRKRFVIGFSRAFRRFVHCCGQARGFFRSVFDRTEAPAA
ncbi:MAG: hypothetical protein ACREDR_34670 [Blastocatellia bacterium]